MSGPEGAALGGAAGKLLEIALRSVGNELSSRLLAPREQVRLGTVFTLAAAEIVERCNRGEKAREDGFFSATDGDRSDAEEVWENALLKSQREPEEKKLPYIAHLMANLAFDDSVSPEMAHQIIKAAEELTYRQLCILQLSAIKDHFNLRKGDYFGTETFPIQLRQILYEYHGLYNRGFINYGEVAAVGLQEISPGNTSRQGLGADMYNLMRLGLIPEEDLRPIAIHLT